jgi:hypothetical protein
MTAEDELKSAFTEVGVQVKKKVEGFGGVNGLERLTIADYNARKAAGTLLPSVVYITVG